MCTVYLDHHLEGHHHRMGHHTTVNTLYIVITAQVPLHMFQAKLHMFIQNPTYSSQLIFNRLPLNLHKVGLILLMIATIGNNPLF